MTTTLNVVAGAGNDALAATSKVSTRGRVIAQDLTTAMTLFTTLFIAAGFRRRR